MPMRIGDARPSFEGATEWLNELQDTADDYVNGQPTLVYFWSTSCGICKENMPKLQELKAKFKEQGFEQSRSTCRGTRLTLTSKPLRRPSPNTASTMSVRSITSTS